MIIRNEEMVIIRNEEIGINHRLTRINTDYFATPLGIRRIRLISRQLKKVLMLAELCLHFVIY